jgi:hypothetical protein
VSSVTARNKGVPEVSFVFSRRQKLGWEKADFMLNANPNRVEQDLRSAGVLLHRFLASKLDNQLQDKKFFRAREIFENR